MSESTSIQGKEMCYQTEEKEENTIKLITKYSNLLLKLFRWNTEIRHSCLAFSANWQEIFDPISSHWDSNTGNKTPRQQAYTRYVHSIMDVSCVSSWNWEGWKRTLLRPQINMRQRLVYQDIVIIDMTTMNILSFPCQGLPTSVNNKCTCTIQDPLKSTPVPQKICAGLFLKHCAVWLSSMATLLGKDHKFKWAQKNICEKKVCLETCGRGKGSEEKWVAPLLFLHFFPLCMFQSTFPHGIGAAQIPMSC